MAENREFYLENEVFNREEFRASMLNFLQELTNDEMVCLSSGSLHDQTKHRIMELVQGYVTPVIDHILKKLAQKDSRTPVSPDVVNQFMYDEVSKNILHSMATNPQIAEKVKEKGFAERIRGFLARCFGVAQPEPVVVQEIHEHRKWSEIFIPLGMKSSEEEETSSCKELDSRQETEEDTCRDVHHHRSRVIVTKEGDIEIASIYSFQEDEAMEKEMIHAGPPSKCAKLKKYFQKNFGLTCGKVPLSTSDVPEVLDTKIKSAEYAPPYVQSEEPWKPHFTEEIDSQDEYKEDYEEEEHEGLFSESFLRYIYSRSNLNVTTDEDEDSEDTDILDIFMGEEVFPSKTMWQMTSLPEMFGKRTSRVSPARSSVDTFPRQFVPEALLPQKIPTVSFECPVGDKKAEKSKTAVKVLIRKIISHTINKSGYMCRRNVSNLIEEQLFKKIWSEVQGKLSDIDPERIENCDTAIYKDLCKMFKRRSCNLLDYLYLDREPSLYHDNVVSCVKTHLLSLKNSTKFRTL